MRQHKIIYFIVAFLLAPAVASAVDLGVKQKVFTIEEIDMRLIIARDLQNAPLENIEKDLKNSAENFMDSLTPYPMPTTDHTVTRWVDPSIVTDFDVTMPVQDEKGEWSWQVIYEAGTHVNPLESVRPVTRMLFINGNSQPQVEFAKQAAKAHPYDLQVVLTEGNPAKLSDQIMMPVFYANEALIEKFQLRFTPTLVGIGEGKHRYELAVTEFAMPYDAALVDQAWNGLVDHDELAKQYEIQEVTQ